MWEFPHYYDCYSNSLLGYNDDMKIAIILAGRHDVTDARYGDLVDEFQKLKWDQTVLYEPNWEKQTIAALVDEFLVTIPKNAQEITLVGFSLGALIALVASGKIQINTLILCSPSGYFNEYKELLSLDDLEWARTYLRDFEQYAVNEVIASSTTKRGFIFAGENELREWNDFRQWISDLSRRTGWKYTEIPRTGHEIEAPAYQAAVQALIRNLRENAKSPPPRNS